MLKIIFAGRIKRIAAVYLLSPPAQNFNIYNKITIARHVEIFKIYLIGYSSLNIKISKNRNNSPEKRPPKILCKS